jgi:hypothetical protein
MCSGVFEDVSSAWDLQSPKGKFGLDNCSRRRPITAVRNNASSRTGIKPYWDAGRWQLPFPDVQGAPGCRSAWRLRSKTADQLFQTPNFLRSRRLTAFLSTVSPNASNHRANIEATSRLMRLPGTRSTIARRAVRALWPARMLIVAFPFAFSS